MLNMSGKLKKKRDYSHMDEVYGNISGISGQNSRVNTLYKLVMSKNKRMDTWIGPLSKDIYPGL